MDWVSSVPLGFLGRPTTGLAVLAGVSLTAAQPQKPSTACKLLQLAEIESAIGGKASTKPSGLSQATPGMALDECSVEIAVPGQHGAHRVAVRIVTDLPMDAAEAIGYRNMGTAREQQWKVAGARLEQKTVGTTVCILSGRPGVVGHTVCTVARGKTYLEVDVGASIEDLAPVDVVRSLAQKAVARW